MKVIQISIDDDLHKELKVAAAYRDKSMKQHIIDSLIATTQVPEKLHTTKGDFPRGPFPGDEIKPKDIGKMLQDDLNKVPLEAKGATLSVGTKSVIKTKKDAEKVVSAPTSSTCKNGHPAVRGDRCMGKGCKYSVYR